MRDFMAPAFAKCPGSRMMACVGSTPERGADFAQRNGIPHVHADLDGLLKDDEVDVIYLALPNSMHHEAFLKTMQARKHVLCEKPFAMNVAHAREMVEARRKAGVICRIAHQLRLESIIVRAREIVQSGRLGRLVALNMERASGNPPRTGFRADVTQSGVVFDVGVHILDMIQWITGQRFVEMSAFTHPDRKQMKSDDTVSILGVLDQGCQVLARASRELATSENNLIIEGSDATLITSALRFTNDYTLRVRDAKGTTEEKFAASPVNALEIQSFEQEVLGNRSMLPDEVDALHNVAATQALLTSIMERRIVPVMP